MAHKFKTMKKLTPLQWVALIGSVLGFIVEINLFEGIPQAYDIIGRIILALSVVTFAITGYNSFSTEDVVDFIEYNNFSSKSSEDTRTELKKWRDNK